VKHPFSLEKLFSFLDSQSIVLSDQQLDQFRKYLVLLKTWSRKQNLVSKKDIFHLVERHFLPSTFLSFCLPDIIDGKLIDIGTGAGFPGIVLKILRPDISLTLLDSSHNKVLFLEEVCEQLALDCPIICQRCEEYNPQTSEGYHLAVSRAVARLDLLWKWSRHLIEDGGCLYAIKGGDYQQEIDELSVNNFKVKVITPDGEWLKASNYLNYKNILKLET
jgi:16S rRNA (guanine527-N7)-methyltransferase